jgi:membrane protease YdiL (CAAX protease family)
MFDLVSTIALHSLFVIGFGAALHFALRRPVDTKALAIGLGVFAAYFVAVMLMLDVQDNLPFMAELKFNWSGKVLAICLTLVMMALIPQASAMEMGLTLRQNNGSLLPSTFVAVALCAFAWGVMWLVGNSNEPTIERLIYQATLPGLDEELFFRGLLFAVFLRAFPATVPSAKLSYWPAAVVVTFLFAAGHAFIFNKGALAFDPLFLAYAALLGFGLLWIRQRTGSLLLPVLVHNVINLGNSFIPA